MFAYNGSPRNLHAKLISLAVQLGCQHVRKMSIGEKIADLANKGNWRAEQICLNHPEFFTK